MPRFRQPIPLEKLAFDYLVDRIVGYCDEHSCEGFLSRFRKGVGEVKQHFREWMPDVMFAEFCRRFISEFYSRGVDREKKRPRSHYEAALEIMMDTEITGLTLEGAILYHLHSEHADRIRKLETIDWTAMTNHSHFRFTIPDFDLRNLTTLICPEFCTDLVLAKVKSYCSELRELRIQQSILVTDDGLCALQSCHRLRILNVSGCTSVTDYGINELLSANVNLEEFNLGRCETGYNDEPACFDILSRARSLVCPSVKRFAFKCNSVTDEHLRSVVEIFPNLTRLEFYFPPKADLRILKDLKDLKELDFSKSFDFVILKQLLTVIGRNITVLNINHVSITQNDVKFIFEVCRSVECLAFNYRPQQVVEKLVIPSSQTLNSLNCAVVGGNVINADLEREFYVGIEMGVMWALKFLRLYDFFEDYQIVESIILDHVKFPNLREVGGFYMHNDPIKRIEQIAKSNNLDFSIRFE